ncbi:MAG: hypothetical protein AAB440_03840 [Patescibacteria group bacterium]
MLPLIAEALLTVHALGAALGVAGVTFAEMFYTRAVVDEKIDTCEKKHILHTLWALRWGVMVTVLSGVALVTVEYYIPNAVQTVLTPSFWVIQTLTIVVIVFGVLISRSQVPWWLGSSATFTAWWMMLALHAWRGVPLSYVGLLLLYVILTLVVACVFHYLRTILKDREERSRA